MQCRAAGFVENIRHVGSFRLGGGWPVAGSCVGMAVGIHACQKPSHLFCGTPCLIHGGEEVGIVGCVLECDHGEKFHVGFFSKSATPQVEETVDLPLGIAHGILTVERHGE